MRVDDLMQKVGLSPECRNRFPHEFSGGQKQRIVIARALSLNPKLLVLDEPVSALDVSVQSQILNLLKDLQDKLSLTYVFIAHGMNVVKYMSDRVAVMYLGNVVETAYSSEIYSYPLHPYTIALFSAIPTLDANMKERRVRLEGDIPSPVNRPSGCPFHTRCPRKQPRCIEDKPELVEVRENHFVACHIIETRCANVY
jgi:oligopeptide/dipeptide ABC transporter ATP-binding protein